jgi:hypothetical protein
MDVMRTGDPNNFGNGSWPGGVPPDWPWPVESPKVLLRRLELLTRRRLGPDRPAEEFELELPITYDDDSRGTDLLRTIMVPDPAVPFTTDLTSVPRLFTWLVPKSGRHLPAALIHDGLIGGGSPTYLTSDGSSVDRIDADQVFRNAMQDTGVGLIRRWLVWAAVANASLCSGARAEWAPWKKWWFRGVGLVAVGLIAYLGLAATLDVVNASRLPKGFGWLLGWPLMGDLPWIDDDAAFWKATGQGLAAAIVVPLGLGCLWGRYYRAGAVAGVALATLIHATAAVAAVAGVYHGAEWVASHRWARVVVGGAILVVAAAVFVASISG